MRVLMVVRDGHGDWELWRDVPVSAVTEDRSAMKVRIAWWRKAVWRPVDGLACRLLPVEAA